VASQDEPDASPASGAGAIADGQGVGQLARLAVP
jgi:hypothetical protein